MRLHLGFAPTALEVSVNRRTYRLRPSAAARWRVQGTSGVLTVSARTHGGGASYVARIVIRPRPV